MRHAPAPQPSSAITTLRVLVMLACLVGIPVIALRGTAVPEMIREYLIQKLGGSVPQDQARNDLEEAPPFAPQVSGPPPLSNGSTPGQSAFSATSGPQPPQRGGPDSYPAENGNPAWLSGEVPYSVPQEKNSPPTTAWEAGPGQVVQSSDAVLANYNSPAAYPANIHSGSIPQFPSSPGTGQAALPEQAMGPWPPTIQTGEDPGTIDQFLYIQQRLRELGANYYLLESWGNQGDCYRFHCRIAVANSANFTKHFEATDDQPLGAMTRVLAEVEAWRQGSSAYEPTPTIRNEVAPAPNGVPNQSPPAYDPYRR